MFMRVNWCIVFVCVTSELYCGYIQQMDISNHQYMLLDDFVVDTDCSLWNFHRSTICYRFWCMMWSKYCNMFLVHKTWLSTTWAYSTMICIQLMIWKWIVGVSRLFVVYFKLVVYGWIVDGMNCTKNWSSSVKLFRTRSPYFSFRIYGMEWNVNRDIELNRIWVLSENEIRCE